MANNGINDKIAKTMYKKYGKDYYSNMGKIGGKLGTTGGFASLKVGKDGLTGKERAKLVGGNRKIEK